MVEPKSPYEHAADHALRALRAAPPLALIAVAAAVLELGLTRIAWNALPDVVDAETLRGLRDFGRLPRNLAAVGGLVALCVSLIGFLRHSGFAPIGRRLAIAAFSGIFVPSVIVATVMPYASLRARLVVFGLAAANVLVTLIAMTAVRYRPHPGLRFSVGMLAATSFLSLLVVGVGLVMGANRGIFGWIAHQIAQDPESAQRSLLLLRHLGEVAWMGVIAGGTLAVLHGRPRGRDLRFVSAALVLVFVVALSIALREEVGHRFRLTVFATFRFGLLLDDLSLLYAVPVGVAFGGGVVGLASRRPAMRQAGAGLLFWLLAGYAPHTPIQLLYLVLATMLLTRSAQAMDPKGAWRRRHPWLSLLRRRANPQRSRPIER